MELIRPSEISAKILSLIEDAQKELIIISPYNDFAKWDKLNRFLNEAKERNVKITYYARENENYSCLNSLAIKPILIKNLHAKMYLNESYAILSSMNLVEASDKKSLDFAIKITDKEKFDELYKYYIDYIKSKGLDNKKSDHINETPVVEFFNGYQKYKSKKLELVKNYFTNSSLIKEFGFNEGGKKFGIWFYYNADGLLVKTEKHFEEIESDDNITYAVKVSKYDILFSIANIIGSLYNCSIQNLYFKSYLKNYTAKDPEKLYNYLEVVLKLKRLDRDLECIEDLVNEIHRLLIKKPSFIYTKTE